MGKVKLADWTEPEVVQMLKIFAQIDSDRSGMIEKNECVVGVLSFLFLVVVDSG